MTAPAPAPARPRLAVFKFASCDGCQLSILNLEEELLALAERVEIAHFLEASSRVVPGPWDVALVEGSITTPHDAERIRAIRAQSRLLVTIGACATSGGIQALRNLAELEEWKAHVYPRPEWIAALPTSTPIAEHVAVDHELQGCPIDRGQLLRVLVRLLLGTRPDLPLASVCLECKRRGQPCVLVTRGVPCLGPVTRAGCGAICPGLGRDCYGCFGPAADPNPASLLRAFEAAGLARRDAVRRLRHINGWRREFRSLADALERKDGPHD
ncbi:MAG: oxidoreductase [Deltaproteobacteria bacterium]|nr:oxidoreductase [Deltaproteobacteria bacterium]